MTEGERETGGDRDRRTEKTEGVTEGERKTEGERDKNIEKQKE